jgi:tetratricopeptide (TPR) repeat protein
MERRNEMDEFYRNGIRFYNANSYGRAIQEFTRSITNNPDNAQCYYFRGMAYFYDQQYNPAIVDFEKAVELDPDNKEFKEHLDLAERKKKESEGWKDSPVPPGIATKRIEDIKPLLKKALEANKDIRFREFRGGVRDIKYTYALWGTERMDKKFPRDILRPGTYHDGYKYTYEFTFDGSDRMTTRFIFGIKDQNPQTINLIKESCRKCIGNIPEANNEGAMYLLIHASGINLNKVFSYEEVLNEVNKEIRMILELENKIFQ